MNVCDKSMFMISTRMFIQHSFALYRANTHSKSIRFAYEHSPLHVGIQYQINGESVYHRLLTIGSSNPRSGYEFSNEFKCGMYSVYGTRRKRDDYLSMIKQLDRICKWLQISVGNRGQLLECLLNICSKGRFGLLPVWLKYALQSRMERSGREGSRRWGTWREIPADEKLGTLWWLHRSQTPFQWLCGGSKNIEWWYDKYDKDFHCGSWLYGPIVHKVQ